MKTKQFFATAAIATTMLFVGNNSFAQQINDSEIKTNIHKIENATDRIFKLDPISYSFTNAKYNKLQFENGKQFGFLTENIESVFPEMVYNKPVGYDFGKYNYKKHTIKEVSTNDLIPVLVAAIKELKMEIDQLKTEIVDYKAQR
jgi:peptidoglycan hydrolase CwlO-like protein